MFGPLFKEEVVGYSWELTTGTKPPPGTWKSWDIETLQGRTAAQEGKINITADQKLGQFLAFSKKQCCIQ